ncbi:vacuolar protein sorting 25-like protein [Phyllostomus discolor]|uniref:Vacuolar protein-sorting-associated protein 25 n=1 Tax=Phyllostomus discolor TaxID=89673 RepID=A0A833ZKI8_9CHIR|nr:vacuolar protein sorting 25-like protein [Phyllostomus discolor]
MAMSFEWPWQYRFPPFFTLQPNVDTRQKQLAAWCSLVLSFCRLHKQSSMTVMEAQESPLFNNVKLQRKLPVESIQIVLEELRKKGNLEWLDKNKSSFLIMWRRPEEWGKLIYQWVSRSGQNNSVFTLYDTLHVFTYVSTHTHMRSRAYARLYKLLSPPSHLFSCCCLPSQAGAGCFPAVVEALAAGSLPGSLEIGGPRRSAAVGGGARQ